MDTRKQRRNSLRLQGYDYSDPGDYFVTVCTYQRALWLCDIEQARVVMTPWGKIVQRCWHALPRHYDYVHLGAFTLMPNHWHGIITLTTRKGSDKRHTLSEMIRWVKGSAAQAINRERGTEGDVWWQRGFYDVIIRDTQQYEAIHQYIVENPLRWELDRLHPHHPNPFPIKDE